MKPLAPLPPSAPRTYNTEEISSFTARSNLPAFSPSQQSNIENEWAESEVGEGVEEIWSRAWSKGGRLISTLERRCFEVDDELGHEVSSLIDIDLTRENNC
jgi:ribonuclease T2